MARRCLTGLELSGAPVTALPELVERCAAHRLAGLAGIADGPEQDGPDQNGPKQAGPGRGLTPAA